MVGYRNYFRLEMKLSVIVWWSPFPMGTKSLNLEASGVLTNSFQSPVTVNVSFDSQTKGDRGAF